MCSKETVLPAQDSSSGRKLPGDRTAALGGEKSPDAWNHPLRAQFTKEPENPELLRPLKKARIPEKKSTCGRVSGKTSRTHGL